MVALDTAQFVIVGAGIAGVSTAAALARAGLGPGLILEREPIPGAHASGKNAGIARLAEFDPVIRDLAVASLPHLRGLESAGERILRPCAGYYLGSAAVRDSFEECVHALREKGIRATLLDRASACERVSYLRSFAFEWAIESADEGVIDIHALLLALLEEARRGRFSLLPRTEVSELQIEDGRVCGVVSTRGVIRTQMVIDASGAWAGRLGRPQPLPLQPVRRHLFVSGPVHDRPHDLPIVWHVSERFYLRPEGAGLLLCPCDESEHAPGVPTVDPAAADMLAAKLMATVPSLAELPLRTSWACLRTFAPDRRPLIGHDLQLPGLFHVSGLGGFGMGTSWAIGEVAAALLQRHTPSFVDVSLVSPARPGIS